MKETLTSLDVELCHAIEMNELSTTMPLYKKPHSEFLLIVVCH